MNDLLKALLDGRLAYVYLRHRRGNKQVWIELDYHTPTRRTTMMLTEEEVRTAKLEILPLLSEQALEILGPDEPGREPVVEKEIDFDA